MPSTTTKRNIIQRAIGAASDSKPMPGGLADAMNKANAKLPPKIKPLQVQHTRSEMFRIINDKQFGAKATSPKTVRSELPTKKKKKPNKFQFDDIPVAYPQLI